MSLHTRNGELVAFSATIGGRPVPWARARSHGSHRFEPARQREHRELVAWTVRAEWLKVRDTLALPADYLGREELLLTLTFAYPAPQRDPGRSAPLRPDLDNLVKLVLDALDSVLITDDGWVVALTARKLYADAPAYPDGYTDVRIALDRMDDR